MATVFETLLERGIAAGNIPGLTQQARNWYRREADQMTANPGAVITSAGQKTSTSFDRLIGKMCLFTYAARTSNDLPYWDRFPLIFPFGPAQNGFYGINMHYLPLPYRAKLMDGLYDYASDDNYDENTYINMSYNMLNAVSKLKYYRPCVKHYLNTGLRSRIAVIPADSWDIALFMPMERFQKANKYTVWEDSMLTIRKRR
jgi:hypothetical protein